MRFSAYAERTKHVSTGLPFLVSGGHLF